MKLEIPIRKQISLFSMMVAFVLFFTGCQGGEENGTASVRLSFNLSSSKTGAAKTASAPAPSGITSVRIDVTGPGMELLSDSVAVNSGEETVVDLEIPAGPARRFVVTAFDIENTPQFRGEQTVDLVPGSSANIRISMASLDIPVPPGLIEISPRTAFVPKDQTETFSVTGDNPPQVQWQATSTVGNDPEKVGIVDAEGVYTPPATILTDADAPLFGNPTPVTVTATDINNPTVQDSATVHLTTGLNLTFEENRRVTPTSGTLFDDSRGERSIAFYQGHVYAVWSEFINQDERGVIVFSESTDGITWTRPLPVNTGENSQGEPALAVGPDGSIYVVYLDCSFCTSVPATIRLAVRRPNENVFRPINLTMLGTNPQDPTVTVSPQGTVYVVWSAIQGRSSYDILLQRIDSTGNPIDASPKNLTIENGAFNENDPQIAVGEGEDLFLTWQVSANSTEIAAIASLDGGDTFLPEVRINDTTDRIASVHQPSVTAGPQRTFYVAWEKDECNEGCTVIFYNIVTVGSSALEFQEEKSLGFALGTSERQNNPSIVSDPAGDVHIAFHETLSGFDFDAIFLAKSSDGAATFTYSRIDDPPSDTVTKSSPSLAVDSAGRAFAIWNDRRLGGTTQQTDIFFAKGE